jgi:hypothetical protein
MTGWLVLGGVLVAGFAFLSLVFAFALFVLKSVFFLIVLPFRLIGWAAGAVATLIGTALAVVIGLAVLLAPLIPLAIVVGIFYGLYRLLRRPTTVPSPARGW